MDTVLLQMFAGAVSGIVTKTAIAPLERVKIIFQIQDMNPQPVKKYKTITQTLRVVAKEEGLAGWFKGNGANVLRVIPVYALKFGLNDALKALVIPADQVTPPSVMQLMAAGSLAGLMQQTVTYPLETIRTRLSVGVAMNLKYNGIIDCARQIAKTEGLGAFYKGLTPTIISSPFYVGLQMTFYEVAKSHLPQDESGGTVWYNKFVAGAMAGLTAQSITYPGDTIRKRMQTNGAGGAARHYTTTLDCCKVILKKEGIRGFYNGLLTNAIRAVPGASIQFAVYEQMKTLLGV